MDPQDAPAEHTLPSTAEPSAGTAGTTPAASDHAATPGPSMPEQAGQLLGHVAGYIAHRTIELGLRAGLIEQLAREPSRTHEQLADDLDLDVFYVGVWCRAAFSAGILERAGDGYRLADHLDTLLLDGDSPTYVGGMFPLMLQPELFDRFAACLHTGERLWWDETSPEWIARVSATGRPFYARLIPDGLARVPGLSAQLEAGCTVVDTACGTGAGVRRLAEHHPRCEIVGVDGDAHSIEQARRMAEAAGLADRTRFLVSPLEELALDEQASVVINNISMHECRDMDRATAAIRETVAPGGWFIISDFPFPEDDAGLRSVPGRIMAGIQYFEAQIDDQLQPRSVYDTLLERHGFVDVDWFQLTPVHAVTWGRAPD